MSYYLQAIFFTPASGVEANVVGSRVIPLDAGIFMLPIGREALIALGLETNELIMEGKDPFPGALSERCLSLSRGRRLIYAEAGFHGGPPGFQGYLLFENGSISGTKCISDEYGPISEGLRRLGVERGDFVDEFERVGLDQHRTTNDWLKDDAWAAGKARKRPPSKIPCAANEQIIQLLQSRIGIDSHVLLTDGRAVSVRNFVCSVVPTIDPVSGGEELHVIANAGEGEGEPREIEVFSTAEVLRISDPKSGNTLLDVSRRLPQPLVRTKVIVRGIEMVDRFVNWVAPSHLVDVAYVEEVRADGAVVLSLDDSLHDLPGESDKNWFREILLAILRDEGKQIGEVTIEFCEMPA